VTTETSGNILRKMKSICDQGLTSVALFSNVSVNVFANGWRDNAKPTVRISEIKKFISGVSEGVGDQCLNNKAVP